MRKHGAFFIIRACQYWSHSFQCRDILDLAIELEKALDSDKILLRLDLTIQFEDFHVRTFQMGHDKAKKGHY
jgi:hypothetical protein